MAFLVSINLSLGGLILGSTVVFATHKLTAQWFNEVRTPVRHCPSNPNRLAEGTDGDAKQAMMGSRLRIWTSMIVLSYPFMAAAISTYSTVVGECLRMGLWCGGI